MSKDSHFQLRGIDFFIPCFSLACADPKKVSHIFLEDLNQYVPDPGISYLIRLPDGMEPSEFLSQLSSMDASFVVVVPVIENWHYWNVLQQFQDRVDYVLDARSQLSSEWMERFKSLKFTAVTIISPSFETLALKKTQPDLLLLPTDLDVEGVAKGREHATALTQKSMQEQYINFFIDPLQPLTQEMPLEVYETFEQDEAKYEAYEEAIDLAVADILNQKKKDRLTILVVGPGKGPLLAFAAKYMDSADIIAVEKNPKCIPVLHEHNKTMWKNNITIIEGDIRDIILTLGPVDLAISELIGSFGCNEACPEILNSFSNADTIMIPQSLTSYIRPIFCELGSLLGKRPYLLKSDERYWVDDLKQAFRFTFPGTNDLNQRVAHHFRFNHPDDANALEGHFKADLYGHISITSTRLDSSAYVCSSWYPMVFSIPLVNASLSLVMERKSTSERLWYEWTVNETVYNRGGEDYFVPLK